MRGQSYGSDSVVEVVCDVGHRPVYRNSDSDGPAAYGNGRAEVFVAMVIGVTVLLP